MSCRELRTQLVQWSRLRGWTGGPTMIPSLSLRLACWPGEPSSRWPMAVMRLAACY